MFSSLLVTCAVPFGRVQSVFEESLCCSCCHSRHCTSSDISTAPSSPSFYSSSYFDISASPCNYQQQHSSYAIPGTNLTATSVSPHLPDLIVTHTPPPTTSPSRRAGQVFVFPPIKYTSKASPKVSSTKFSSEKTKMSEFTTTKSQTMCETTQETTEIAPGSPDSSSISPPVSPSGIGGSQSFGFTTSLDDRPTQVSTDDESDEKALLQQPELISESSLPISRSSSNSSMNDMIISNLVLPRLLDFEDNESNSGRQEMEPSSPLPHRHRRSVSLPVDLDNYDMVAYNNLVNQGNAPHVIAASMHHPCGSNFEDDVHAKMQLRLDNIREIQRKRCMDPNYDNNNRDNDNVGHHGPDNRRLMGHAVVENPAEVLNEPVQLRHANLLRDRNAHRLSWELPLTPPPTPPPPHTPSDEEDEGQAAVAFEQRNIEEDLLRQHEIEAELNMRRVGEELRNLADQFEMSYQITRPSAGPSLSLTELFSQGLLPPLLSRCLTVSLSAYICWKLLSRFQ